MTGLFEARDGRVTLALGRCRACGLLFFPPQSYGCERCGANGGELAVVEGTAAGTLLDAVRVPGGDGSPPEFTLARIQLDEGVVVRAVAADGMASGTTVVGVVRELHGRQVLAFQPAEGPTGEPTEEPTGEPAEEPAEGPAVVPAGESAEEGGTP